VRPGCARLNALGQDDLAQIDALFITDLTTLRTPWNELKADTGNPTLTHLRELVARQRWLATQAVGTAALADIPAVKVRHFAEEARTLDRRMQHIHNAAKLALDRNRPRPWSVRMDWSRPCTSCSWSTREEGTIDQRAPVTEGVRQRGGVLVEIAAEDAHAEGGELERRQEHRLRLRLATLEMGDHDPEASWANHLGGGGRQGMANHQQTILVRPELLGWTRDGTCGTRLVGGHR